MEPTSYELLDPIEHGSEKITRLDFKPLKAKHMKEIGAKAGIADFLKIAVKLTGISSAALDEMSGRDTMKVVDVVAGFLKDGQETGDQE